MKKFFCYIIASVLCFSFCACTKEELPMEELPMEEYEFVTYVGNEYIEPCWSISSSEFENEEEKKEAIKSDLIEVEIEDMDIATFYDASSYSSPIYGKKIGKTNIKLTYKEKTATVVCKVYSAMDYLAYRSEKYTDNNGRCKIEYQGCVWLINNIEAFKDPGSVEVVDCIYHETDSGVVDYYMMEIRAKNSFGAYGKDWYMVHYSSIGETYSPYIGTGMFKLLANGFYSCGCRECYTQAVKEYCENK